LADEILKSILRKRRSEVISTIEKSAFARIMLPPPAGNIYDGF